jgi:N-methylhydantoinase A
LILKFVPRLPDGASLGTSEPQSGTLTFRFQPMRNSEPIWVAIDSGGTFTDCISVDRGRISMLKVFSTPDDPSRAIATALETMGIVGPMILLHGTTVGTNTLLERKGGRVALVTTAGFEDVIEIGRQARAKLYDFFFDRLEPLVPRGRRFGVEERTSSDGEILHPPSKAELARLSRKIGKSHSQAVAISLLFSFANPENERRIGRALENLGLPLSLSHRILPEFREYERTSTIVVNAYLQPVMEKYLENLVRRLEDWDQRGDGLRRLGRFGGRLPPKLTRRHPAAAKRTPCRLFLMQSSGGITALDAAVRQPVRTVLSGPAGGVVGAAAMAKASGYERVITFDMGGTSTDVALVDREARPSSQSEIAGLPVGVPMLDIHTVGAGGGSIARLDAAGALRVGPESAGADPGPICYGRGTQPTVTDANLILGRLRADRFLGGSFTPDLERTRRVLREWLNRSGSRLSLEQLASGMIRVVNATMEKAIRVVSIERGHDPREFALVAFGGAGGLHACDLAEALGIPQVMIPRFPGALSAFGILVSDVVKDYSKTVLWPASAKLPFDRMDAELARLGSKAKEDFRREGWPGHIEIARSVDVRYRGQGYELSVPYSRRLLDAFEGEHERRYGYRYPQREIEIVTLRLRARIRSSQSVRHRGIASAGAAHLRCSAIAPRRVPVVIGNKRVRTTVYDRNSLLPGDKRMGPAIVTEYSATTLVPAGRRFGLDGGGNLIIDAKPPRRA